MNELTAFYKSVLEQDNAAVVICNLNHEIIYMNPAAVENYKKYGGQALLGQSLFGCHNEKSCEMIEKVVSWFAASEDHNKVHTFFNVKQQKDVYMTALRDDSGKLIGYYEKHEYRTPDESPLYYMP
ncbi:MAG: PAS domain-containing protein [Parasporobacterium sp.]|nr:PAS domain-containing protein [Parasporobacterium sp.]